VVQVALTCLSKTLKRWEPTIYSIVFLCIMATYFSFTCLRKAYNYPRTNMWQAISVMGVLQLALIAVINDTVYTNPNFKLVILVGILWALLIGTLYTAFGLLYQQFRLPSLLYRKRGRHFSKILRFAFTNRVSAAEIQPTLNYARNSDCTLVHSNCIVDISDLPNEERRIPSNVLRSSSAS